MPKRNPIWRLTSPTNISMRSIRPITRVSASLLRLAASYGVRVPPGRVVEEIESGDTIRDRPAFAAALVVLFMIDLEHQILPNVITIGGIVSSLKQMTTKKGDPMVFLSLDDLTGEAVVAFVVTKGLWSSRLN